MPKIKLGFNPDYSAVSKNIRKLMIDRGIERIELSDKSYINYKTLCEKLSRRYAGFNVKELANIAHTLNVDVSVLFDGVME